jgi:WD40 repeat protein
MGKLNHWTLLVSAFLLAVAILPVIPAHAAEPDYPPKACADPQSPNYRPNIAHTVQDKQLLLLDTDTGATLNVLDTNMLSYRKYNIFWARNCRYLVAVNVYAPFDPYPRRFTSIYDTFTGRRIFHSGREILFDFMLAPTGTHFLIKSGKGFYLMSESFPEPVLLTDQSDSASRYTFYYEWDVTRAQLLINFRANAAYLMIYDLNTGAQIAALGNPEGCSPSPTQFARSVDDHFLLVYPMKGDPACVTVYNQESRAVVAQVNAELRAAEEPGQIAISPDGRYLVIGRQVLRVWDLTNQPEEMADRLPVYRHDGPDRIIHNLRFITNEIVETTTLDGVQQWNVLTGEQIPG